MELQLTSLEEQVQLEVPHRLSVLCDPGHQEASVCSVRDVSPFLAVDERAHPQAAGKQSIAFQSQIEGEVLSVCCRPLRCTRISSCHIQ